MKCLIYNKFVKNILERKLIITAAKGMKDILPDESYSWHIFEENAKKILGDYFYQEIRTPIIERSNLFHRSVGELTEVSKQTYKLDNRGEYSISLRPEGTAGCVRSIIEHNLLRNEKIQKIWYMGPMFRYERPQKGRYRQFHQLGVEVFGNSHISQEVELINIFWRLLKSLGLSDFVKLEINSLGNAKEQNTFKQHLLKFLKPFEVNLDDISKNSLLKNPLRILDTKNEYLKGILKNAPKILDFIDMKSKENFNILYRYLKTNRIPVKINQNLVRGLDYYSGNVFEWVTDMVGSQNSICGGGRYDHLVSS